MERQIKYGSKTLNTYTVNLGRSKLCLLFLPGGGITLGKKRYREWQENLKSFGVNSISFDYSGVNGSGDPLEKSSLKSRIEEAVCVTDWMKSNINSEYYILYGVSMGGYVALGLTAERLDTFEKLILHAPAAYSSKSHEISFGEHFTEEIKKQSGWEDSFSFYWLGEYNKPILFIEAERDKIIPEQIIEKYKAIKHGNNNFKILLLKDAGHDLWKNDLADVQFRNEIYTALVDFIT